MAECLHSLAAGAIAVKCKFPSSLVLRLQTWSTGPGLTFLMLQGGQMTTWLTWTFRRPALDLMLSQQLVRMRRTTIP